MSKRWFLKSPRTICSGRRRGFESPCFINQKRPPNGSLFWLAEKEGQKLPSCGARKNLRAAAFPRFFRPLRQPPLVPSFFSQKVGSDRELSRGRLQPSRRTERDLLQRGDAAKWVSGVFWNRRARYAAGVDEGLEWMLEVWKPLIELALLSRLSQFLHKTAFRLMLYWCCEFFTPCYIIYAGNLMI